MEALYLIKIGEIILKAGNRAFFLDLLKRSIKRRMGGVPAVVTASQGRFFLAVPESAAAMAEDVLSRVPGVNGWARAIRVAKEPEAIGAAAIEAIGRPVRNGAHSFKVEARRSDKSYPLESYGIAADIGDRILAAHPGLRVDVHAPDTVVYVEIRDQAYVYADGDRGVRGLPVGSAGRGLALLSGGIDSPVAAYMMLTRGLALEAIHFNAYPYTSREAWEKVHDLARIVGTFSGGLALHTVPFTEVQVRIKKDAPPENATLYLRACMMMAADALARQRGLVALVTGESLGQVASQTVENMRFSGSFTDLPVFRPLVGMDKEDTIRTARSIGTYETSILPYEDCCVLFSPKHPLLKADFGPERERFLDLGLDHETAAAVAAAERFDVPFEPGLIRRTAPR